MKREDIPAWCWHEAYERAVRLISQERRNQKAARLTPEHYLKEIVKHAKRIAKEAQ